MQCDRQGVDLSTGIERPPTMPADPLWAETIPATAPPPFPSVEELNLLCGLTDLDSYEVPDVMQSQKLNPPASIPLSGYDYVFASDTDGSQSPLAHDRAQKDDQFEGIGNWPRRLLHVPSMTSLEWQPGDQYGGHVAPRYNAVSYTWGRYDLDFPGTKKIKKYRNIKAIEIDGVTWRVPRINPTHFSVDHFQHLIWQTCEPVDDSRERIDFLWLDVACIDQNDGSQKSAEIGRQAVIFHGAQRVFVWLTKVLGDRLSHIVTNLLQSTSKYISFHCRNNHQKPILKCVTNARCGYGIRGREKARFCSCQSIHELARDCKSQPGRYLHRPMVHVVMDPAGSILMPKCLYFTTRSPSDGWRIRAQLQDWLSYYPRGDLYHVYHSESSY